MTDVPASADPTTPDRLADELVALGRSLAVAPPDDLAEVVLARIATAEQPSSRPARGSRHVTVPRATPVPGATGAGWVTGRGRRLAAATAAAVVLVVALVPPVRATVLELFRIGGVSVREAPAPPDTSGASGTTVGTTPTSGGVSRDSGTIVLGSLVEAERRTGLSITTPPALGPPDSVALTRDGRVVELTWGGETDGVRLDVFDGGLAWGYLKTIWQEVTPTEVAGREGVWFPSPHLLQWVDRSGRTEATEPRVAGPTLVWVGQGSDGREITYRLEGPRTLSEALALVSGGGTTVPQR